jgi:transporter family protein
MRGGRKHVMKGTVMTWQMCALASAFFAGLQAILGRVGVQGIDSNLATALRTLVVLMFAWGIVWAQGTFKTLALISPRTGMFLVLSGLSTGISWLFYFHALKIGPGAARVATLDKLSLVFVVILAAVFLRETVGWKTLCGVALIISGALLISSDNKTPDARPEQSRRMSTHVELLPQDSEEMGTRKS